MFHLSFIAVICLVLQILYVCGFQGAFNANHELLIAARNGDSERISEMIGRGAYLEARNNNGVSALILAANNGHLNAVRTLLESYADIEARSNDGRTPLVWASHWGHLDIVLYLLDRGAQIDAVDSKGMTALMHATLKGHKHVVLGLIEQGADVSMKNDHGGTALSIAKASQNEDLIAILETHFVPDDTTDPHLILVDHALTGLLNLWKRFLAYVQYYTGLHPTLDMISEDL